MWTWASSLTPCPLNKWPEAEAMTKLLTVYFITLVTICLRVFFSLVPLPRADGSFYFIFHIKYDYFFVPKATCRSLVSALIIYVGNTQQDLLSVGWCLNKGRRINILTSVFKGKNLSWASVSRAREQAACQHLAG